MQKAIITCPLKQKEEIENLLKTNRFHSIGLVDDQRVNLIMDIEDYQVNLLISIIKHYKIIRNDIQLYMSYREI